MAFDDEWRVGQAAWPDVVADRTHFEAYMATNDRAQSRFAADLYLASACLAGHHSAIAAFDRELLAAAVTAIRSIDKSPEFVDEACQRLRATLLVGDGARPRIADYAGRGPLRAWVGVAAVRTALMLRRSRQRVREVHVDDDWSSSLGAITTGDPELELLKRQYADAFAEALRSAVRGLEPRLRTVLRMSYVKGLSIDEIGGVYAVHRATAARWIRSACEEVFQAVRVALTEQLRITGTEVDRIAAMVKSQLDVSLSQLLPETIE